MSSDKNGALTGDWVAGRAWNAAKVVLRDSIAHWMLDGDPVQLHHLQLIADDQIFGRPGRLATIIVRGVEEGQTFDDFAATLLVKQGRDSELLEEYAASCAHVSPAVLSDAHAAIRLAKLTIEAVNVGQAAERGTFDDPDELALELARVVSTDYDLKGPAEAPTSRFVEVGAVEAFPNLEKPHFAIEGLLYQQSFTIVGGDPKAGKTTLAAELAFSIMGGGKALGEFDVYSRGPAVFVQCDMGEPYFSWSMQQIAMGRGMSGAFPHPFHYLCTTELDLDQAGQRAELRREIAALKPSVVVLDPMRDLHSGGEDKSEDIKPVLDFGLQVRDDSSCCVLMIDHLTKPPNGGAGGGRRTGMPIGYLLRGAGSKYARADSVIAIQDLDGCSSVSSIHRYGAPTDPFYFEFVGEEGEDGHYLRVCEAPEPREEYGRGGGERGSPEIKAQRQLLEFFRNHAEDEIPAGRLRLGVEKGGPGVKTQQVNPAMINLLGRGLVETRILGTTKLWKITEQGANTDV